MEFIQYLKEFTGPHFKGIPEKQSQETKKNVLFSDEY